LSASWNYLLSFLMLGGPFVVAIVVGAVVFGHFRSCYEGQCEVVTLRLESACTSAVVTAVIGVVVAIAFLMWLTARPENNAAVIVGMIALAMIWLMAAVLAFIVGCGPGRHVRRPGE